MSTNALQRKSARLWLRALAKPAKRWIQLTVLISFISGLLLILQLYLLAHISYSAYIEKITKWQLISYFIAIGIIVIVRALLAWVREIVSFQAAAKVKLELRDKIIQHINTLGPITLSKESSGDIISAAMEQVEGVNNFLTRFLPQISLAALMPIAILVFIFPQSIVSGIILLVCAPLIPLFMMLVGWGAESENQKHFKTLARMSSGFLDTLQGLSTLKLFNRGKPHAKAIFNYSDQYRVKTMKVLRIAFLSSAVLEVFSAASIALVAIYLGMGFINAGADNSLWWSLDKITLQGGLFILLLAPEFFLPLRELSTHYHAKAEAVGAAIELEKLFALTPQKTNDNLTFNNTHIERIDCQHLSFSYHKDTSAVLKDINLSISRGQKVAIIGPSGAGKTTLLNLLLKFIHAEDNAISINHKIALNDINEKEWLKHISWLGQTTGLFKGTIRSNLLLANPEADDNTLFDAIKMAKLEQFISTLPMGLDTEIGEQSLGLSGGQAQRLGLARAYLKPCDLLLLDEPTASLDSKTEKQILNALYNIWQHKTVIMLTHRFECLAHMDNIIVMDNGKIVQQGTLDALCHDKNTLFYKLYAHHQKEGEKCAH